MKFQMFKLDLEKAEEQENKSSTFVGSSKKQENNRKTSTSALLKTMPKPLTVFITTNCGEFFKRWEIRSLYLPPEKSVCRSISNN